jgi:hypothetical protein
MKTILIPFLIATVFTALANATSVSARYLRFDGYASTNGGHINIFEIEAHAAGVNVARTGTATTNSGWTDPSLLIDGNTTSNEFSTDPYNPGQPSLASPHRLQIDFGSVKAIDQIRVFFQGTYVYSFGLFLSADGVAWTPVSSYTDINGLVTWSVTDPIPVVVSAVMRPGTTLMDVVYRVNDRDDATVKTRALAFVDGVRSFSNVLRPVTFVEGTAAKIGDAIPTNTNHTLTWDVGADWNIGLGQVKFEILCRDARGLLAFDWITIPAAAGKPALTISKDAPSDASVLNALFWQYADGDPWLALAGGVLSGNAGSGVFADCVLANGSVLQSYSTAYLFKRMNLDPADSMDMGYAANTARAGLLATSNWHAVKRPYTGVSRVVGWGSNSSGQTTIPAGLNGVIALAAGSYHSLALKNDGTVGGWGGTEIPAGLSGVTAIAAGGFHSLALKSNGTVVGWGDNQYGQTTIPAGLSGVTAIAAGTYHSLALRGNGTVVGWGRNSSGQTTIPAGLSGVTAIAAGDSHSLALKSNGTVGGWGESSYATPPTGLSGVTAIAAGTFHSLALKSNGTVVGWGNNNWGQTTIPAGLSGVTAIADGYLHSLALKSDGTVVCWGKFWDSSGVYLPMTAPAGLTGFTVIGRGSSSKRLLVVKAKAP